MEKPAPIVDLNQELSVSELSFLLKKMVEVAFDRVTIRGEISGVKKASSGHIYFTIKDDNAVIDAVSWRGQNSSFASLIVDGAEVVAGGKITTYPMRSNYQIVVDSLSLAGVGNLLKQLEELKKKLLAEGLFDANHKKPIPFLPSVVGVVTSPTGAVIRDIINRISDRFPLHIILWPVAVQGNGAAEEIAKAIRGFNQIKEGGTVPRPDVLIVARGGGSVEDLWAFNEEVVVRATYDSQIPIVSAVGHETDTTLIDYASDLRAPTPTGAAEMVTPVLMDLLRQVKQYSLRMPDAVLNNIRNYEAKIQMLTQGLPDLSGLVDLYSQKLDDKAERLDFAMKNYLEGTRDKLQHNTAVLELCSYQRVLDRGFSLILDKQNKAVTSVQQATQANNLQIVFSDGKVSATIDKDKDKDKKFSSSSVGNKNKDNSKAQGELLL